MRPLLIALAAALLVPASASAAPFEELPFQTMPGGATCVRATGAPGELVAWAPGGARFLRATAPGLSSSATVSLGDMRTCPAAAAQPNGAGVVAAAVSGGISVALREPGAAWAAPSKLALPSGAEVERLATAVSERGDAVVMWSEDIFQRRGVLGRLRIARRPAGGAFGAPQTLVTSDRPFFDAAMQAGIAADGTAIAAWSHIIGDTSEPESVADLSIAAPGAPFGGGQRLTAEFGGGLALALAADGHALVAFGDNGRLRIAERAPGGGFGAPQTLGSGSAGRLAVVLGTGAEALVAWGDEYESGITYARRTDASGFRPPVELIPDAFSLSSGYFSSESFSGAGDVSIGNGPPPDNDGGDLRAAYANAGRVVLSWGEARDRNSLKWVATHVATVSPDDSYATQVLSGPLRDARSIAPIVLETGAPAVAWSDNGSLDGRLHLAAEGATAPARPAVRVRIGKPERTALRRTQSLVIPVTCSAACDLRATARGLTASASLTRAGTVRLRFSGEHTAAPLRAARVPVTVLSGPPGARDTQSQTIRPRLRRIPDPPLPRVLGLTAIRSGSTVTVSWRLNRSAVGVDFVAFSSKKRAGEPGGPAEFVRGSAKTTVTVTLRRVPASHKYVNVQWERSGRPRTASVKIR